MKPLTKEEKLQFIYDYTEENAISAYKIAKHTGLNEGGVGKILQKKSKNPHKYSVQAIYDYLTKEAGINAPEYFIHTSEEEKSTAKTTFLAMLETVNKKIIEIENQPETIDQITLLRRYHKLRLDLLGDLEELNK
ncbi:hypothetical protein [Candidatus Venteria ishoeyi]|uniref:Uncharacterized protein n=1 Tax=Candidatus Venteria ishoeyi TaxID=1899563 RepID=A0A1H6F7B8_9GAMM|nr:hypothetical protein [Candidatus Venteria ishoeyi]SEH05281.1 Uncharacterised protein [Candidatus Venteria ishoeyi]